MTTKPKPKAQTAKRAAPSLCAAFNFVAPCDAQASYHILEHVDLGVIGYAASLLGPPGREFQ